MGIKKRMYKAISDTTPGALHKRSTAALFELAEGGSNLLKTELHRRIKFSRPAATVVSIKPGVSQHVAKFRRLELSI